MRKVDWFEKEVEKYKDDIEFITESVILEFTESIVKRMEELSITRTELAKRLNVSKAFITKLLNGNPNLTIKTMVAISKALDCAIKIELHSKWCKN